MEGEPVQELAAIEMNIEDCEVVDVFHAFANIPRPEVDAYCRMNIHGLSRLVLAEKGYPDEASLLAAFKTWLSSKRHFNDFKFYCNDAVKEKKVLSQHGFEWPAVWNLGLVPWAERDAKPSHQIGIKLKRMSLSFGGRKCPSINHSEYYDQRDCISVNDSATVRAKAHFGHHCALYDAVELYYEYLFVNEYESDYVRINY